MKKIIAALASAVLAITGSIATFKNRNVFQASAKTWAVRCSYCQYIGQSGMYSYFHIQFEEANFGHPGVNHSWIGTAVPQYKVDPYMNPWNVSPWNIYSIPESVLNDSAYFMHGTITIR